MTHLPLFLSFYIDNYQNKTWFLLYQNPTKDTHIIAEIY